MKQGMENMNRSKMIRDNRLIGIQQETLADRVMGRKGLTAAQAYMLHYILQHSEEGTSLTAMHREFGYSKAALSSSLKSLRQKGYVRVERCPEDDRRKRLFATEQGCALKTFLEDSTHLICDRIYAGLSPSEWAELDRLQKKVRRNLSANEMK